MTGDKFLRGLLSPIPTRAVLHVLQSGYAADFVLGWSVESLNGLRNRSTAAGRLRAADPEFVHALELMREIQVAGGVSIGVEPGKTEGDTTVVVFGRENLSPEALEKSAALRRLLDLPADQTSFRIVTSPVRAAKGALAMQPRSLLQVMMTLSSFVDVPPEHVAEQRAVPGVEKAADASSGLGVRIHHSRKRPADSYAAVQHRGVWFWVDDRDWHTKRVFVLIMFLFTLSDTSDAESLPVLTIPTS